MLSTYLFFIIVYTDYRLVVAYIGPGNLRTHLAYISINYVLHYMVSFVNKVIAEMLYSGISVIYKDSNHQPLVTWRRGYPLGYNIARDHVEVTPSQT